MDTRWAHSLGLALGLAMALAPAAGRAAGVEWLQKPTVKDFVAAYPPRAATEFMAGKASIGCKANPDGYLIDCKVISETPADYGFGDAAVTLSAKI
ncbi:MAG TPA: hypothetical protein VHN39_04505, partial [Phenylobacterium sp.]|nr:hypothetical protein [Phenylobacterium sp.]